MQITRLIFRPANRGVALISTLIFLGVVLLVFASMFYWVNTNANVTMRNNQYNMSENAAEAAVERVVGQMDRDFESGGISNNSSIYSSLPLTISQSSWPIQYIFSSTNGTSNTIDVVFQSASESIQPLNSEYAGLNGQSQGVDVYATATPVGQRYAVPSLVHESVQFADIPLYQFAIFYNVNLEIACAQALNIYGPVFCNQNIWEGSDLTTYYSTVTAHGTNSVSANDPFSDGYTGSTPCTFKVSGQPVNNANEIVMPIGTNNSPGAVQSLLELPPAPYFWGDSQTYSSNGIVYPANAADLVISNYAAGTNYGGYVLGTNFAVYYQDAGNGGLTLLPYNYYWITNQNNHTTFPTNYVSATLLGVNTNIFYAGFTWLTNVIFYDWRENYNGGSGPAKQVQAVQIDMGQLNKWLTNDLSGNLSLNSGYTWDQMKLTHSGNHISAAYVYTAVPPASKMLPAVRVMDGAQLPAPGGSAKGFTVATEFPIYVWGDYNSQNNGLSALGFYGTNGATANTLPGSLMGDSVTILSTNWTDVNSSTRVSGGPSAANTTVNAAMLSGIVPTNPSISGNYSGGVENFLRLLENWSSATLTYNGSIVVLYYSQFATNSWQQTGGYYTAPTRHWAFDLNYTNALKLPPMTPQLRAMIRGNWYAHE